VADEPGDGGPQNNDPVLQPWPKDWMPVFLLNLRNNGVVREACEAAGVTRVTVQGWRAKFPRFRAAWDEAMQDAIDQLETEAWKRAMNRSDLLLWKLLQSLRRDVYGERLVVDVRTRNRAEELAKKHNLSVDEILAEADAILVGGAADIDADGAG
jgi:hypothetical protein